MSFLFYCRVIVFMSDYHVQTGAKKTKQFDFRLPPDVYNLISAGADFFGISKSLFIKERCLSFKLPVIGSADLLDDDLSCLKSFSLKLNDIAFDFNRLYKQTLETNRLDLVFNDIFSYKLNDIIECIELFSLVREMYDANKFEFECRVGIVPVFENCVDDNVFAESIRSKRICIRVTDDFYKLIKDISNSMDISVSRFIINTCLNPNCFYVNGILNNPDFINISKSIGINIRQIIFAEKKINERNIICSGGHQLFDMDSDFLSIVQQSNLLLKQWNTFRMDISKIQRDVYFEHIKKRELNLYVKNILENSNPEYLKSLKNREIHI